MSTVAFLPQAVAEHFDLNGERSTFLLAQTGAQVAGGFLHVAQQGGQAGRGFGTGRKPAGDAFQPIEIHTQEAACLGKPFGAAFEFVEHGADRDGDGDQAGLGDAAGGLDDRDQPGAGIVERAGRRTG